ncbi:MAG: hypothetical protein AAGG81_02400, partial [Chlamydiota bacterium]
DSFHHGTDKAFKVFSTHSLTGFFMMFGWVGLACYKQYGISSTLSILVASVSGVLMMVVTVYLFKLAALLVSSGTKFHIEESLGRRATVYQKIPASGVGKIQITVNGYQREICAVSENHQEIGSFTEVTVKKVIDNQMVAVMPNFEDNSV